MMDATAAEPEAIIALRTLRVTDMSAGPMQDIR